MNLKDLKIKIYSDGADLDSILEARDRGLVKGFTTNPTLMSRAGITNYMMFAKEVLRFVTTLPVSFEVFSDDFGGMRAQALTLRDLAENVYVKIPIMNTKRESAVHLIRELAGMGVKLNVTAIMTTKQVAAVAEALAVGTPAVVSVFAGRIADAGVDPVPLMAESLRLLKNRPQAELLWASPREVFNIVQAEQIGCHIITVTPALLSKAGALGKDLEEFSLETVKMFYEDACSSGFHI